MARAGALHTMGPAKCSEVDLRQTARYDDAAVSCNQLQHTPQLQKYLTLGFIHKGEISSGAPFR